MMKEKNLDKQLYQVSKSKKIETLEFENRMSHVRKSRRKEDKILFSLDLVKQSIVSFLALKAQQTMFIFGHNKANMCEFTYGLVSHQEPIL